MCEERSDELKRREYWISMYMPDTSKCNVAATKFLTISNATNAPTIAHQRPYHCNSLRSSQPKTFEEGSNDDLRKKTVMLSEGDVLLSNVRVQLRALGMKAEYRAGEDEEQLIVNKSILVRKRANDGKTRIEGPLCEDYFAVRSVLYNSFVML